MKRKNYEPTRLEKFFGTAEVNGYMQSVLAGGTLLYFVPLFKAEPLWTVLGALGGFAFFGGLSIFGNACEARYSIYKGILERDNRRITANEGPIDHLPIPSMQAFLRRGFYAWILYITAVVTLLFVGFFLCMGLMMMVMSVIEDNQQPSMLLAIAFVMPIYIMVIGLAVGTFKLAPVFVDHYVLRNDLICLHLYKDDEKPLALRPILKGIWRLFIQSLLYTAFFVIIVLIRGIFG